MTTRDERLLVVTLSNIGDLVLTTPLFETLAERFPGLPIDVVGDARSLDLLAAAPWCGALYRRDKRAGWRAQWALLRRLRQRRYRLVVDLRTPFLPWLLRADQRLVKRARGAGHAAVEHHAVLAPLGVSGTAPWCRLHLAPAAVATAAHWLDELPAGRWLAIAPGANWPGKKWPLASYVEFVRASAADFAGLILLGGAADRAATAALADCSLAAVDAAGRADLPTTAALIARAAAFVGNDSGPGHMAAALDVPTLTLFGPGRPQRYRPWGRRTAVAYAPGADLAALTPAAVRAALRELLAEP